MENWAGYVEMVSKRGNDPTQLEVDDKIFEAMVELNKKLDRKVENQKATNKLIDLALDIMGSKLLHKEKVLTERLNAVSIREEAVLNSLDNIDESLAQMYNRIKHLERVVEGLEFVQSNKKCCK